MSAVRLPSVSCRRNSHTVNIRLYPLFWYGFWLQKNTPTAVYPWICSYIMELSARKETVNLAWQQLHTTQTLGNCFITWSILMAIPSACTDHHVTSKNIKLYAQRQWEHSMKILIYNALCFTKIFGLELHVYVLKLIYQITRTEQDVGQSFWTWTV
jgi:hypothetical protein